MASPAPDLPYTSGPWKCEAGPNSSIRIIAGGPRRKPAQLIATMSDSLNSLANARLLVEAPALNGLLGELLDNDTTDFTPGWYARARACRARIRGEAP